MIFSKFKMTTALFFLLSLPFLLIGCQQIQSATNQQASQTQLRLKEKIDVTKLQKLAEQGNAEAQFKLAERYREGIEKV